MNYSNLKKLFDIGRPITKDDNNPYIHFAYIHNKQNYRLISSGEMFIKGKDIIIPEYVEQFMNFHNNALMIADIISNKIINIVFRSLDSNKEFLKYGSTKGIFYGLGELDTNFRYGDAILLVEGHLDRDVMATMYKNTLGIMTNRLSNSQLHLLTGLTNKFILMLDNDEAGRKGQSYAKHQLEGNQILELEKDIRLKDAGELVTYSRINPEMVDRILDNYKMQIELFNM